MPLPLALLLFGVIAGAFTATARHFGASRSVAFAIPTAPLALWLMYCILSGAGLAGHGGAMPLWLIAAALLLVASAACSITLIVFPNI
jgi:hypothetical protein